MSKPKVPYFPHRPACKSSIAHRKPVYGVGINDAPYVVLPLVGGKQMRCPYYERWMSMLARCYSTDVLKRKPTYKGQTVCPEWLYFMKFKEWMIKQKWYGLHLNKNLIVKSNKVYSPDACIFVTRKINNLLNTSESKRGKYPQGVRLKKGRSNYSAEIRINNKVKFLGYYSTVSEAERVYIKAKQKYILKKASKSDEPLKSALERHANTFQSKTA